MQTTEASLKRTVLILHPTGNANVRQAALALSEAQMLAGFHTTIVWQPGSTFDRLLPISLRTELERRSYPDLAPSLVHAHPWREVIRLLAVRRGWKKLIEHESGPFCTDVIYRDLDRTIAGTLLSGSLLAAVYTYEDCAVEVFHAAKKRGIRCIYELPIGHYRAYRTLMAEERELRPEWVSTLTGLHDSAEKLARKDQELAAADVIMVASSFTAKTLKTYPDPLTSKIHIVPYGAPPVGPPRAASGKNTPLRILYVGSVGQRKGIGYLIEATEALDRTGVPYTFTILGQPVALPPVLTRALERHRWIRSAPHAEVLRLMREHDVLVFPSLFEGFGLVILEAMAQGTVVISTPHTAAPDLIDDCHDGFIVPIRSADAIADRLTLVAEDRHMLSTMSEAARKKAEKFSWNRYRENWLNAIKETLTS